MISTNSLGGEGFHNSTVVASPIVALTILTI